MKHTLHIRLSACEGAVLKALDLMERRGFSLQTCHLEEPDENGRDMQVIVQSVKPGDLLKRQLERLWDVQFVELLSAAVMKPSANNVQEISRSI